MQMPKTVRQEKAYMSFWTKEGGRQFMGRGGRANIW